MRDLTKRKCEFLMAMFALGVCLSAAPAFAQFQNPLTAAKDAYKNAKAKQPAATQPAPATASSQPVAAPAAAASTAPASPTSSTAATPAASSAASPAAAGDTQLFTPPSDNASAFAGPLDPSKLPDVAGIHIGMPKEEVGPVLQKLHPGAALQPQGSGGLGGVLQSVGTVQPNSSDNITVDYTLAPNKSSVFLVNRNVQYLQPIAKQVLVDALRQKYGKETMAANTQSSVEVTDDSKIYEMWWLFDEQGKVVHPRWKGMPHGGAIRLPRVMASRIKAC
jgi:hypothetical protein